MTTATAEGIRNRIVSLQRRETIASQVMRKVSGAVNSLKKELAILEYGNVGDTIKFTATNGTICDGKIVEFQDSFFNDVPICIVEVQGEFVPYRTHLGNGGRIIR
jgi:hypothetical protein